MPPPQRISWRRGAGPRGSITRGDTTEGAGGRRESGSSRRGPSGLDGTSGGRRPKGDVLLGGTGATEPGRRIPGSLGGVHGRVEHGDLRVAAVVGDLGDGEGDGPHREGN